jgi:hypothetical protein
MITARYSQDYNGEFVIINTDIRRGIKQQQREWMPKSIDYKRTSNRAAVIGHDIDRKKFDYARLPKHRGGRDGENKLITYGTGSIWQHLPLDFYCSTDRPTLAKLSTDPYVNHTVCFTNARLCMIFSKKFYLVPFQPRIADVAAAAYLAAFNGHREIFMLGLHKDTPILSRNWQHDIVSVMAAYRSHQFVFVGVKANMHDIWLDQPNADFWDYRRFITGCDI